MGSVQGSAQLGQSMSRVSAMNGRARGAECSMEWHRVRIDVPVDYADYAGDVLWQVGSKGVEYIDPNDLFWRRGPRVLDEIETRSDVGADAPSLVGLVGYFPECINLSEIVERIGEALRQGGVARPVIRTEALKNSDWQDEWKRHYRPLRLSERVLVVPEWESVHAQPGEIAIRLDPGMAFGTGNHPTTIMSARMLQRCVQPGVAVLDLGTGSAILAILSALLGASTVTAVDIDPVAVERARHNVELNAVSNIVHILQGDLIDCVDGQYDVVVANIIASVILRLLPHVHRVLAPGGRLIISGIVRDCESECLDAADKAGFAVDEICRDGEWVGALLHR